MGKKKKQPWGITLNCIVLALAAILSILGAIALAFLGTALNWTIGITPLSGIVAGMAFVLLIYGIVAGILCYYLWNRDIYAWWIVLVMSLLGLISAIFTLPFGVISVLISLVLVAGLLHKDTIKAIKPGFDYKGWG